MCILLGASLMFIGPVLSAQLSSKWPELNMVWDYLGKIRTIVGLGFVIVLTLSFKPIWRFFWRLKWIKPWISELIAYDLNGEWDVTLNSNYPVVEKLKKAAKGKRTFDVAAESTKMPELSTHKFTATIDQGWEDIRIMLNPIGETPLQHSETLSCAFFKQSRPKRQGLTYVYTQKNTKGSLTDDEDFFGAAEVIIEDFGNTLRGHYWTRRQWQKGLNTAGTIVFERKN